MKKSFWVIILFAVLCGCQKFDDGSLWDAIHKNAEKIANLEQQVNSLNTNVSTLKSIVDAFNNCEMITSCAQLADGSGYTIVFTSGKSIVIKNGKDGKDGENGKDGNNGKDGENGHTPVVGVKQDTDGIFYWTIDGNWLLDLNGKKVVAQGSDGKDGANGTTPVFKIEEGYWYISYNNGDNWTKLGKATGEKGADGIELITKIEQTSDGIVFTLADGNTITIPMDKKAPEGFVDLGLSVYWAKDVFFDGICTSVTTSTSYTQLSEVLSSIPSGSRLPTKDEVNELISKCVFSPAKRNNRSGLIAQNEGYSVFFLDNNDSSGKKYFTVDKHPTNGEYYSLLINSYNGAISSYVSTTKYGSIWLVKDK